MKISETIERECCQSSDLKPYLGLKNHYMKRGYNPKFCIHCGQIWLHTTEMGPAGSMEPTMEKVCIV